jgi:putative ABC transport system permease protein
MGTLLQDVRYALRQLAKSPGFTITVVLSLAIGIGVNTAGYSSMDAVVLHPLAVPRMDRVVTVAEQQDRGEFEPASLADFEDWNRQSRSFQDLAPIGTSDLSLTGAGDAAHVRAALTSASFFRILRAQPLFGRVFSDAETQPGRDAVAVLNYGFWQRRFAADPAVLGRRIELNQRVYTIVGVLPKTMQYPSDADFYLPFAPTPQQLENRSDHRYDVIGRLRVGATVRQAQEELRMVAARLAKSYPATNLGLSVRVEPLLDGINGDWTPMYYKLVMGATLFVLLVVCANISNLQFARGLARRPEIAMRTALGASRGRVLRQLLTENLILGIIGAACGLAVGALYLHVILITMPARVARYMSGWSNTSLNGRVLAFSVLLAVGAGLISGIAPAIEALRLNVVEQLKSGSRGTTGSGRSGRLRSIFAVSQIALAAALVIGAALMSKGMNRLLHMGDVYEPAKVLTFNVTLPANRYDTPQKQAAWYADSLAKLRALPGVTQAEVSTALPYSDNGSSQNFTIENRPVLPGKFQSALRLPVSEGYFSAFRIPIVAGRGFSKSDALGAMPVAIVSRRFATQYFPGEIPIGRRIRMGDRTAPNAPLITIVGVAEETSYSTWDEAPRPAVYLDAAQIPSVETTYAVMIHGDAMALAPDVRKALAGLDPALPLDVLMSYQQYLHELLTGLMYAASMMVIDALFALLLAAIGIFGVMANLVGERTREIGVRLAMGAAREDVLNMMLRRATWLTAMGLGCGLVLAFTLSHLVANLLRGVSPNDPTVFVGITVTIAAISLAASWIPARRASGTDPMVALRDD